MTSKRDPEWRLVAEIGGTQARFALRRKGRAAGAVWTIACRDYPRIEDALIEFLATRPAPPGAAAFAVASPNDGDDIAMLNGPWRFSIRALCRRFGFSRLDVVNDFAALALAVPRLRAADLRRIGGGRPVEGAPIALIGPGTGLGVAGLVPARQGPTPLGPVLLASEGGHATLGPANDRESDILAVLRTRFGHVSAERAVSGPGLVRLFEAICELEGEKPPCATPEGIVRRALDGSSAFCAETLQVFCALLGTVAADVALTFKARGGVYIGGGIVPKLGDFFAASPFRQRFESKGRYSKFLSAIPTSVIRRDDAALIGLSILADRPLQ
jgi:glucokinase